MDTAAVRGAFWLASDQLGSRVIDMVFAIVLARLLFPEAFGLFALAATSTAFFRLYANMGLGAAVIQRRQIDQEYLSTAFWANMASGVVLCTLIAATAGLLGTLLREPRVGILVLVLSSRFVIAAGAATQMALFSRKMDFRALALRSMLATTAGGLTGVGLALAGLGVWSLVGQEVSRVAINTALLYRATGWRPTAYFSWAKFRDLWSFGGPVLLSRLFSYLVRHSDNLLVGRYLGATALGYYAFGFTLFAAPLNDVGAIVHRVMFSALSRLQGDDDRFRRGFLLATRYITMLMMPAMIGLAVVAPLLVGVVFGEKWLPSSPVVSILALGGFLSMLTALGPSGLQASGRPDLHLRRAVYGLLVYLPAFATGLRWGIVGVAAGYLVGTALLAPVGFRYMMEATGVDLTGLWDAVAPAVVGSGAMAAVVSAARWALAAAGTPDVIELVLLVLLGIAVYGATLWLISRQAVLGLVRVVRAALPVGEGRPLGQAE
jgi:PST family polysaccharide transporter